MRLIRSPGGRRLLAGPAAALFIACAIGWDVDLELTVAAEPAPVEAELVWTVGERSIHLAAENRGRRPLRLRWDLAAFHDEHGRRHELIVAERLYGPYRRDTAVELAAGDGLECVVWPADYAYLDVRSLLPGVRWSVARPLLEIAGTSAGERDAVLARARRAVGTELSITLPIERDGRLAEHRFVFTVTDTTTRRARDVF